MKYIPTKFQSKTLVDKALANEPLAIQFITPIFITQELCNDLFQKEYSCFSYFPEKYISVDMCLRLLEIKRFAVSEMSNRTLLEKFGTTDIKFIVFDDFPEKMRNNKQVLDLIIAYDKYGALSLIKWNERLIKNRNQGQKQKNKRNIEIVPLNKDAVDYITPKILYPEEETSITIPTLSINTAKTYIEQKEDIIVSLEPASKDSLPVVYKNGSMILHNLSETDTTQTIYYISDIHIEHQLFEKAEKELKNRTGENKIEINTTLQEEFNSIFNELLEKKIDEMIEGKHGILLIGGDVADSLDVSREFYNILSRKWNGIIVSILGNHELWDGTTRLDWANPDYQARTIEEIVGDYRNMIGTSWGKYFLENALLIKHKNERYCIISETDILKATPEDLKDIISKSTLVVLGGIGYSGLNDYYNSDIGLYRKAITSLDEDKRRASMFCVVYDKVKQCAYDKQIIVLTHTPVCDWSKETYNPNWIYVNGHTHQNSIINEKNGATVLSDNQIGYKPQKWKLNAFTTNRLWYDPFELYDDGVYKITSDEYRDFNQGRGIKCNGCSYKGNLYAIKRNGKYMFVLESSKSLCLMTGGARKKLERNDVQYYYNNMAIYEQRILKMIEPYQKVMRQLSQEVKNFGGTGTIHGCIVDISWYSHIYVNPFDGEITSYWALDTSSRFVYNDIKGLLEDKEPELLNHFLLKYNNHSLPLIGKHLMTKNNCSELAIIPQWIFGTEMYKPSKIMRSVQYVWEQNVIRIWQDNVLNNKLPQIEETNEIIEK